MDGAEDVWGYVQGGMGRVSFAIADAAAEAGAVLAAGVEVAAILPGEGVRLAGGELLRAGVVVSNADPKRTVALCQDGVPDGFDNCPTVANVNQANVGEVNAGVDADRGGPARLERSLLAAERVPDRDLAHDRDAIATHGRANSPAICEIRWSGQNGNARAAR